MNTLHRPLALGTVATLLAAMALVGASNTAQAAESTLPGIDLPVPATDITDTDTNLGSVAHEVVVVVDGPDGKPEVRKLKARTQAEAEELATELNAEPSVTASLNRRVEVPSVPSDSGAPSKAERSLELTRKASPKGVLAGEPAGSYQWGLQAVNAEGAWSVTRGSGVIVAVVDTGVDTGHPDLAGQVMNQIDLVGDGATGDPDGHGTHVAGIVAAALDGSGTTGLANQVKVLPVRVLGEDGGDESTVANGIITSVNAGAKVINLSLGWEEYDPPAVHSAVQYALNSGVTVVAAAGNEYLDGNPVEYPVAQSGVIGVASIGAQFNSSAFSNAGSYVDISAPGEDILSTVPGGWDYSAGTSMAAPFVAATAALVRVANPTLTKVQVDDVLLSTALDDADGDGWDSVFGYGLVQADKATMMAAQAAGGIRAIVASAAPTVSIKVKAASGKSRLKVDVNPNKGRGFWTFQVQKRNTDGTWKPLKTYKTQGAKETRTINLPKGTYQVVVNAKYGYAGTTSAPVYLKK